MADSPWWKRISPLERRLVAIVIVGGFLCSGLVAGIGVILSKRQSTDTTPTELLSYLTDAFGGTLRSATEKNICVTSACIHDACKIINNMDKSVKPCDNFYKFACGKFIEETTIPDDKVSVTAFSAIADQVQEQLKRSIEEPHTPWVIERQGVKPLLEILEELGGWPILKGDRWNESTFHWIESIPKLRDMGLLADRLIKIRIGTDLKTGIKRVIYLEKPSFEISREYIAKGMDMAIVKEYHKYMIDIAVLLGAPVEVARKELVESLEFEIALANISQPHKKYHTGNLPYHQITIKKLSNKYPSIPWTDYINKYLAPQVIIGDNENIVVNIHNYIRNFEKLIKKTPRRIQANYYMWRIISASVFYLNEDTRRRQFAFYGEMSGKIQREARWKECIRIVSQGLPLSAGSLYIKKYFNEDVKKKAVEIVEDIKDEFNDILIKADWMDGRTRKRAFDKATSMVAFIAYPDEILDNKKLIEYYKGLQLNGDSYLKNILYLTRFNTEYSIGELRKPLNKTDWKNHAQSASVNFFYSFIENSIQFHAAILQMPFFDDNRQKYMNYGAIGSIIGHEITHGFDNRGRLFDKHGNLMDWWTPLTERRYLRKSRCIISQYRNYNVPEIGLSLNGRNTHIENIADIGGVKLAYLAYRKWASKNGREKSLPGLNYTPRQLFWISAANIWCAKHRPETLKLMITRDSHSPGEFRILGPFSNIVDFARDFQCSVGTRMNPKNKCSLW